MEKIKVVVIGASYTGLGIASICENALLLEEGEMLGIVGKTGAGKTTLVKCISKPPVCIIPFMILLYSERFSMSSKKATRKPLSLFVYFYSVASGYNSGIMV